MKFPTTFHILYLPLFLVSLTHASAFAQLQNTVSAQLYSKFLLSPESLKNDNTDETTNECKSFIASLEDKFTYGWVEAPLNYTTTESNPNAEKIKVFYYYKKTEKFKNPILFFNGGPGFSSHSSVSQFETSLTKLDIKGQLDFIFIDQRGTGCSSPTFPIGATQETFENLKWAASLGIVNDAEILREHLLGPKSKWKIFGQSYGAYIAYRYIEKFPASVSKAYAHGNAIGMIDYDGSYFRILSQHTVTEKYLKLFSDDRKRLQVLNQHFSDPTKCYANTLNQSMCGYENLSPFVYLLGFRDSWKYLHIYLQRIIPESTIDETALKDYVSQSVSQSFYYRESDPPEKWGRSSDFFL
jgi:pimeloyl-ACP methyl ester carboxylesterase